MTAPSIDALAAKIQESLPVFMEQGDVYLLGLFEREDMDGKWDLMISSSRSDHDPQADIKLFSKKIVKTLTGQELSSLSRMVPVRTTDPAFRALASAMRCEGGANRIISSNFNGFFIKNAVLFRLVSPSESPTIVT